MIIVLFFRFADEHFGGRPGNGYHDVSKRPSYEETIYGVQPRHMTFDLEGGLKGGQGQMEFSTDGSYNPAWGESSTPVYEYLSPGMVTDSPLAATGVSAEDAREGYSQNGGNMYDPSYAMHGDMIVDSSRFQPSSSYTNSDYLPNSMIPNNQANNMVLKSYPQLWPNAQASSRRADTKHKAKSYEGYSDAKKRLRELAADNSRIERLQRVLQSMKENNQNKRGGDSNQANGAKMGWDIMYPKTARQASMVATMDHMPQSVAISYMPQMQDKPPAQTYAPTRPMEKPMMMPKPMEKPMILAYPPSKPMENSMMSYQAPKPMEKPMMMAYPAPKPMEKPMMMTYGAPQPMEKPQAMMTYPAPKPMEKPAMVMTYNVPQQMESNMMLTYADPQPMEPMMAYEPPMEMDTDPPPPPPTESPPRKKKKNPYKTAIDIKKTAKGTVIDIVHKAEQNGGGSGSGDSHDAYGFPVETSSSHGPWDELKLRMTMVKDEHAQNAADEPEMSEKSLRMRYQGQSSRSNAYMPSWHRYRSKELPIRSKELPDTNRRIYENGNSSQQRRKAQRSRASWWDKRGGYPVAKEGFENEGTDYENNADNSYDRKDFESSGKQTVGAFASTNVIRDNVKTRDEYKKFHFLSYLDDTEYRNNDEYDYEY